MLQAPSTHETRSAARELKFLVAPETARAVLTWSRAHLLPDPFGGGDNHDEYRTTSVYFDTEALDTYHRRGSFRRSKYRVRRYGSSLGAFLERKLRTDALLTKRRTSIDIGELTRLVSPVPDHDWAGYWFHKRVATRGLRPTCQVSYVRVARIGSGPGGAIRLTLDRAIQTRRVDRPAFLPDGGLDVAPVHVIVELKFHRTLPEPFKELLDSLSLEPLTVSKYRLSIDALSRSGASALAGAPPRADNDAAPASPPAPNGK